MIKPSDRTKAMLAQYGPVKLFGDFEKRQSKSTVELIAMFDREWDAGLSVAISQAKQVAPSEAKAKLSAKQQNHFHPAQSHRLFRYQDMEMAVQLDGEELTQLWRISSSDAHPRTIFVTFDSVEDRHAFAEAAEKLGWVDGQLALKLLTAWLSTVKPDWRSKADNVDSGGF